MAEQFVFDQSGLDALGDYLKATRSLAEGKQDVLTFDTTPTEGSTNPVTSGGIASVIDDINTALDNINGIPIVYATAVEPDYETTWERVYTAIVPGVTELYAGLTIIIIPDKVSDSASCYLNINDLGDKDIRVLSGVSTATNTIPANDDWMKAGIPVELRYDGSRWIVTNFQRFRSENIIGTVSVANGGTGKSSVTAGNFVLGNGANNLQEKTPAEVLEYIGAASKSDVVSPIVAATSTDGVAYTATVDGMDSLIVGKEIVIVPDTNSTAVNLTLNVNNLGAKQLRCPTSTNNATTTTGPVANWLYNGKPVKVRWNGTFWVTDIIRMDATALYNNVPVTKGGTGASDAATARTNLDVYSKAEVDAAIAAAIAALNA